MNRKNDYRSERETRNKNSKTGRGRLMRSAGLLFLILLLAAPGTVFSSFAEKPSGDDTEMLTRAIQRVKEIVEVPDTFLFDYSRNELTTEEYGSRIVYEMSWYDKDYNEGMSASVDEDGRLIYFDSFSAAREDKGIGNLSRTEAEKTAKDFLKKAIPDFADRMQIADNSGTGSERSFDFSFVEYENDIPVPFRTASITVNKHTNSVTSFFASGQDIPVKNFPELKSDIGSSRAEEAYREKIGIRLQYNVAADYEERRKEAIPAYFLMRKDGSAIDAETGELIPLFQSSGRVNYAAEKTAEAAADTAGGSENELSQAELAEVEKTKKLISKEKAAEILGELVPWEADWKNADSVQLSRDFFDDTKYVWNLSLDEVGYGSVDASTGALLEFHQFVYTDGDQKIPAAEAEKKADAFLQKAARDILDNLKMDKSEDAESVEREEDPGVLRFFYLRMEKEYPVYGNGVEICFDQTNDQVLSFRRMYDEYLSFPEMKGVSGEKEAFSKAAEAAGFSVFYRLTEKDAVRPVYGFRSYEDVWIDPFSGERMNYDGSVYQGEPELPVYTDIAGTWYEDIVTRLLESGYYKEGDLFAGKEKITQYSFLRYLYSGAYWTAESQEDFYRDMIDRGVIKEGEEAPDELLTRQDAARIAVRYIGLAKAAEDPSIFVNPFKDSVEDIYKGYAALSYALNIFKGDGQGCFQGTQHLTNAEAAVVIYRCLSL